MILSLLALTNNAHSFCGTYVGGAGSEFFNEYAQVAVVRSGSQTTLTIVNDVQGTFDSFALVLPIPEVVQQEQARVLDPAIFERLDAYSQARLVTYECSDFEINEESVSFDSSEEDGGNAGVEVEARYIVGEYEVVVLSAAQSEGLFDWLNDNGYQVPGQSIPLLQEYIDAGNFFLAAKVSAEAGIQDGDTLSPLQLEYSTGAFQIPIRLGTLNAKTEQDLVVYTLNDYDSGIVGISNYTEFTIDDECMWESQGEDFGTYYSDRFRQNFDAVEDAAWMVEYAWGGGGCDPCTSEPPNGDDLVSLGLNSDLIHTSDYFFTRLHMRYAPDQVDEELMLYNSNLTNQIQQRYIVYEPEMEEHFPICDVGQIENPGTCENMDENGDQKASTSCANVGVLEMSSWGALSLLSLAVVRRRRS
jgi:hypothetical protein